MNATVLEQNHPWPIVELGKKLADGLTLSSLCCARSSMTKHDIRECGLESLLSGLAISTFGSERVILRKPIGKTLGLVEPRFPSNALPDVVIRTDDGFHICELKSNRTDYSRFDNVFDSQPFKDYLKSLGHAGSAPWEVEQDLIKLRLFQGLSPQVRSCLFVMVDAYTGTGRAWSDVFADPMIFRDVMRTNLVRDVADEFISATTIEPISDGTTLARLMVCQVST